MSIDALVINLTRFGDLLQSQAVIDDLHEAGRRVGLVCLDNFASALPLLRNVDEAWPLAGGRLLAGLKQNWHSSLALISSFAKQTANEANPSAIINLTPTLPARLLGQMLAQKGVARYGFDLDSFGFGVNHGIWASFFSAAATKRAHSPFNLADILRMIAKPLSRILKGSPRLAEPGQTEWGRNFLASEAGDIQPKGFIGFQLGASEERRRWPTENFSSLGKILWQKHGLCPVLLGAKNEQELGRAYATYADHPFINAIGKTDIPQLASLLKATRLLATNDTGTMHLAAGLGVPVLAFFLATAQPWDTGPLLNGSISLEPALDCHPCAFNTECKEATRCRHLISPQTAALYAENLLNPDQPEPKTPEGVRPWRTIRDERGFVTLAPMGDSALSGRSAWLAWQRAFWLQTLENLEAPSAFSGDSTQAYSGLPRLAQAAEISRGLEAAGVLLDAIGKCGRELKASPKMGRILIRNCERLQAHLDSLPDLGGLATFWRELRQNQGERLDIFGRQVSVMARHVNGLAAALVA